MGSMDCFSFYFLFFFPLICWHMHIMFVLIMMGISMISHQGDLKWESPYLPISWILIVYFHNY
uniref:Uncharacterized protein n=1 Tax=Cannabis sativa TaxID=3483 RepID=A0A803R8I4_CANSA